VILRSGVALQDQIQTAVDLLKRGGVVAIPTDTLYGLAADPLDEGAVRRIFRLKGRPAGNPIPLLLSDPEDLHRWAARIPESARRLTDRLWPGPLTLVLRRSDEVPDLVTGGGDTVGLRVPDHTVPRSISRLLGAPLTGTSANRTGSPGLSTAHAVRCELSGEVDFVVDGVSGQDGRPSTVVDLSGDRPRILRRGAVSAAEIESLCGLSVVDSAGGGTVTQ
jgi:L-threonylcarbamoyladenylate synthase